MRKYLDYPDNPSSRRIRLARAVFELTKYLEDSKALEIMREIALAAADVIDEDKNIHPDLAFVVSKCTDFKEYATSHPDFGDYSDYLRDAEALISQAEERLDMWPPGSNRRSMGTKKYPRQPR